MLTTMLLAYHVDMVGKKHFHTIVPISHLLSIDYVLAHHLVAICFGPMPNLLADSCCRGLWVSVHQTS